MSTTVEALEQLGNEIVACRTCDHKRINVIHRTTPLNRGGLGSGLLVVGICPGKTELIADSAFSGVSGRRLVEWLTQAGLGTDREQIFSKVYFTSVIKCHASTTDVVKASTHCYRFLERQLALVRPAVLMTLGNIPLKTIFEFNGNLNSLIGRRWREHDLHDTLYPIMPTASWIIPFPHPSPLSHWHNDPQNQTLLSQAIDSLRESL